MDAKAWLVGKHTEMGSYGTLPDYSRVPAHYDEVAGGPCVLDVHAAVGEPPMCAACSTSWPCMPLKVLAFGWGSQLSDVPKELHL
jgi:hypothetical protein